MQLKTLLFVIVLIFWCKTVLTKGVWPSRWSPCSNPALHQCGEYATCTGHILNGSNFYTGTYICECVPPYAGEGKVKCTSPCTEDLVRRHAAGDYTRPLCRRDGHFSNVWCGNKDNNRGCRCMDKVNGQIKDGPVKSPRDFNFDDCVDKLVVTGRCKIADEDRQSQLISFSFLTCDIITGNYGRKMCDLTYNWECWCVERIRGREKPGSRVNANDDLNCEPVEPLLAMCTLPYLENGRVSSGIMVGRKIQNRHQAYFRCNNGFRRRGPGRRVCRNGKLSKSSQITRCVARN